MVFVTMQEKAKPAASQGRKATGFNETAGLPKKSKNLFTELLCRSGSPVFLGIL